MTRTFNGVPFKMKEHVDRLFRSLKYLQIDPGLSIDDFIEIGEENSGDSIRNSRDLLDLPEESIELRMLSPEFGLIDQSRHADVHEIGQTQGGCHDQCPVA